MGKFQGIKRVVRDFVSDEKRDFKFRLGATIASSLFGLICGVIISSIIWIYALDYVVAALRDIYSK